MEFVTPSIDPEQQLTLIAIAVCYAHVRRATQE